MARNSTSQPGGTSSRGSPGAALTQTAGTQSGSCRHQSSGGSLDPARSQALAGPPCRVDEHRADPGPGRRASHHVADVGAHRQHRARRAADRGVVPGELQAGQVPVHGQHP